MTDRPGPGSIGEVRARREDLRQRMIDVEAAAARPARADAGLWRKAVRHELDALREAWGHHVVTTERPDGFLDEVIAHAPQLASRRDALINDHVEITERFDALLAREDASVDETRDDIIDLLGALVRHRHKGAELTYDAYNVDLAECD